MKRLGVFVITSFRLRSLTSGCSLNCMMERRELLGNFWKKPRGADIGGAHGLSRLGGKSARRRFIRLDSHDTRLRLFYSLASGGGSVTIIRKSPDCCFPGRLLTEWDRRQFTFRAGKWNIRRPRNVETLQEHFHVDFGQSPGGL